VSLVTALFTRMSQAAADGATDRVRRDLSVGLRLTGVATVLALAGVLAVGTDLTRTMFPGNGVHETDAIAWAATAMMVGLVPFSAQYLFQRVFYVLEDARTPFLIQVPVVVTIALSSYLAGQFGDRDHVVVLIGLGMSAGYTLGAVLSAVVLHRRLGRLDGARVTRTYVRLLAAAVPAALLGWACSRGLHALLGYGVPASAAALAVGGGLTLVGYVGLCRVLHVGEMAEVAGPLLRRLPSRG
jgi:putative peptidoglycan lipid II flippase